MALSHTQDPILSRIPLEFRKSYDAAWARYGRVGNGGTPEEKRFAWDEAIKLEAEIPGRVAAARAEQERALKRGKTKKAAHA